MNALHSGGGLSRFGLDRGDLTRDPLRRRRRLVRQLLHFVGDHGEALPGVARARGLDGRVEGQQRGLRRDLIDQADDLGDLLGGMLQPLDLRRRLRDIVDPFPGRGGRSAPPVA